MLSWLLRGISSFAGMGRKSKLKRFAEVASFPNVFEPGPRKGFHLTNGAEWKGEMKGQWHEVYFKNPHPIVLELACGKGDYTLALAQRDPSKNFIGIDIKGARIWRGARTALESGLLNVAFIRNRIEFIEHYFAPHEVDEIWITFPDPFEKKPNRRLTSAPFLDRYRKFLKPGGLLHLKTDSSLLYEFTLDVIHSDARCHILYANPDIYSGPLWNDALAYKTYYEKQHLKAGRRIKYVEFVIG